MKSVNIIIPTRNRTHCLKRLLSYYDQYKIDYKFIIADSSSDINKEKNKENISSIKNLNILHHKLYSPDISLYYKIADVINYAENKYSVICADDDFITPNGIENATDFLAKNPEYACALGHYISFYVGFDEDGGKHFYWKKKPPSESIISSDPSERLVSHFSPYHLTLYSVHETDFLKMIFKEDRKFTDDDRFGELLPSMLTLIYGKMKILDVFFGAREISADSDGRTSKRIQDFISEGTYNEKYSRFKECLSKHLSDVDKTSVEEAKKIVDMGWKEYTKKHKGYTIPKINYMMKKMSLPPFVDENLRRIYKKVSNRKKQIYMPDFVISHDPQVEKDEEFKRIKRNVLSHYKNEL